MNKNVKMCSEDFTRKVFKKLGIENYLKPKENDRKINSFYGNRPELRTVILS